MSTLDDVVEVHADDEPYTGAVDSDVLARRLMIEAERLGREIQKIADVRDAVELEYTMRIDKKTARINEIRQMIQVYVEQNGPVKNDIGSAFLRKQGDKVDIQDREAFVTWAREKGEEFTRPVFDASAAKAWALQMIRADGVVPDGVEYHDASVGLTIRGAS